MYKVVLSVGLDGHIAKVIKIFKLNNFCRKVISTDFPALQDTSINAVFWNNFFALVKNTLCSSPPT